MEAVRRGTRSRGRDPRGWRRVGEVGCFGRAGRTQRGWGVSDPAWTADPTGTPRQAEPTGLRSAAAPSRPGRGRLGRARLRKAEPIGPGRARLTGIGPSPQVKHDPVERSLETLSPGLSNTARAGRPPGTARRSRSNPARSEPPSYTAGPDGHGSARSGSAVPNASGAGDGRAERNRVPRADRTGGRPGPATQPGGHGLWPGAGSRPAAGSRPGAGTRPGGVKLKSGRCRTGPMPGVGRPGACVTAGPGRAWG